MGSHGGWHRDMEEGEVTLAYSVSMAILVAQVGSTGEVESWGGVGQKCERRVVYQAVVLECSWGQDGWMVLEQHSVCLAGLLL